MSQRNRILLYLIIGALILIGLILYFSDAGGKLKCRKQQGSYQDGVCYIPR